MQGTLLLLLPPAVVAVVEEGREAVEALRDRFWSPGPCLSKWASCAPTDWCTTAHPCRTSVSTAGKNVRTRTDIVSTGDGGAEFY